MASELPRRDNWSRSAGDSGPWDSPKRGPGMAEPGSGPGAVPQMPSLRVGAAGPVVTQSPPHPLGYHVFFKMWSLDDSLQNN